MTATSCDISRIATLMGPATVEPILTSRRTSAAARLATSVPSGARVGPPGGQDVGCDEAWALVHVYAELVAAGEDPEDRFPGVSAHLASCGPCADDFQGLLIALRAESGNAEDPSGLTDS